MIVESPYLGLVLVLNGSARAHVHVSKCNPLTYPSTSNHFYNRCWLWFVREYISKIAIAQTRIVSRPVHDDRSSGIVESAYLALEM